MNIGHLNPHDERFNLPDTFDKSNINGRTPKLHEMPKFEKSPSRLDDLVRRKGNLIDFRHHVDVLYDKAFTYNKLAEREMKGYINLDQMANRDGLFDIY